MSWGNPEISQTGGSGNLPEGVRLLAEKIRRVHGDVHIAKEKNGFHIYFASPKCLELYGRGELQKRHCCINADKHLGLGVYKNRANYNRDAVGRCMKTATSYSVSQLLRMPNLQARGITTHGSQGGTINVVDTSASLVPDGKGNMVPDRPGDTTSLIDLPADHPAIQYLTGRGYSIASLVNQFSASWCYCELPEDREKKRYYKKFVGGFRDTPQNRLCFFADIAGVRRGWQARYLEVKHEGAWYILHPYTNQWVVVKTKVRDAWVPVIGYETLDLAKYKTAFGAKRNEIIMGIDAAIQWNTVHRPERPIALVSEGPLDAGKIGPPGVACLGKSLSENQARLLATHFKKIVLIADNDKPGQEAKGKMLAQLSQFTTNVFSVDVPAPHKDIGDMSIADASALIKTHLNT